MEKSKAPASMTRKHFDALAEALKQVPFADDERAVVGYDHVVSAIATVCARFNPQFDRARFLAACGVQEN